MTSLPTGRASLHSGRVAGDAVGAHAVVAVARVQVEREPGAGAAHLGAARAEARDRHAPPLLGGHPGARVTVVARAEVTGAAVRAGRAGLAGLARAVAADRSTRRAAAPRAPRAPAARGSVAAPAPRLGRTAHTGPRVALHLPRSALRARRADPPSVEGAPGAPGRARAVPRLGPLTARTAGPALRTRRSSRALAAPSIAGPRGPHAVSPTGPTLRAARAAGRARFHGARAANSGRARAVVGPSPRRAHLPLHAASLAGHHSRRRTRGALAVRRPRACSPGSVRAAFHSWAARARATALRHVAHRRVGVVAVRCGRNSVRVAVRALGHAASAAADLAPGARRRAGRGSPVTSGRAIEDPVDRRLSAARAAAPKNQRGDDEGHCRPPSHPSI